MTGNNQAGIRRIICIMLIGTCMVMSMTGLVQAQDNDVTGSLTVGEFERSFILHIPSGYDAAEPTPLIIALHGATMSGVAMMLISDFNSAADAAGALVQPGRSA